MKKKREQELERQTIPLDFSLSRAQALLQDIKQAMWKAEMEGDRETYELYRKGAEVLAGAIWRKYRIQ